jgi:hypothetical protein
MTPAMTPAARGLGHRLRIGYCLVLLALVLQAFLTSLNEMGPAIEAAARLGNLADLRGFAHQLKGAALNVHAKRIAAAANALELVEAAGLGPSLEEFRVAWHLTSRRHTESSKRGSPGDTSLPAAS